MSESEKVEEKYKPFWNKPDEKVKVVEPVKSSEEPKNFFDDMPKYVEGDTSSEVPNVSKKKRKPTKSISITRIKREEKKESSGIGMNIAIAAIGIGVVLGVGYMVINTVMSTPEIQQQLNSTGTDVSTIINGGFALVAVGIIVLVAFGLINIFGGSNGD